MIHYSCKYAPIELFAAFGEEACLLDREEENFDPEAPGYQLFTNLAYFFHIHNTCKRH